MAENPCDDALLSSDTPCSTENHDNAGYLGNVTISPEAIGHVVQPLQVSTITRLNVESEDGIDVTTLPRPLEESNGDGSCDDDTIQQRPTLCCLNDHSPSVINDGLAVQKPLVVKTDAVPGITSVSHVEHDRDTTDIRNQGVQDEPNVVQQSNHPPSLFSNGDDVYATRQIKFGLRDCTIVCQNANGPCPLLAICNVLLLRGTIALDATRPFTDTATLVQILTDVLLGRVAEYSDREQEFENNVQTCMEIFPGLSKGLDVNPKLSSCEGFEFTSQLQIFDIFKIGIYHGWVVDPQDLDSVAAIGSKNYNQLLELVIDSHSVSTAALHDAGETVGGSEAIKHTAHNSCSDQIGMKDTSGNQDPVEATSTDMNPPQNTEVNLSARIDQLQVQDNANGGESERRDHSTSDDNQATKYTEALVRTMQQGAVVEQWLEDNRSQLTVYGLCELHNTLEDGELCVLFRNNHFFTLMKRQKGQELLTLVTDQGFAGTDVVWETLNNISNDSQFLTEICRPVTEHSRTHLSDFRTDMQGMHFPSHAEHSNHCNPTGSSTMNEFNPVPDHSGTSDAQLAQQLQLQERACTAQEMASAHRHHCECLASTPALPLTDGDAELARQMQAEEDAWHAQETWREEPPAAQLREPAVPQSPTPNRSSRAHQKPARKDSICSVM